MSLVTVIVPVYFNAASLHPLMKRLNSMADANAKDEFEFLFVDDGSPDNSFDLLLQFADKDRRVRVLKLARNFGAQDALFAGMEHSRGDAVAVIAADLQDPPELISVMLQRWREGAKVVLAVREGRNDPWLTRAMASAFHILYRRLAHSTLPKGSVGFYLIDRQVCDVVNRMQDGNSWVVGVLLWLGFQPVLVPYERAERAANFGSSRWSVAKRVKLLVDAIVAYSYIPLRAASAIGIALSALGVLYAGVIIFSTLIHHTNPEGWSSLMVVVLVVSGAQLLMTGVLGEYVWRTLDAARRRPRYVVDRVVESGESPRVGVVAIKDT